VEISKNRVAIVEYAVRDEQGKLIDNSRDSGSLSYLHGRGKIAPGLELALEGKQQDDTFSVTVPPSQGFGERDEELLHEFTREELAGLGNLKVGMQLQANDSSSKRILTVSRIEGKKVILDENHPLAGKTVRFDVHVLAVRDATEEELQSGQAQDVSCHDDCSTCATNIQKDCGDDCGCGCHNH